MNYLQELKGFKILNQTYEYIKGDCGSTRLPGGQGLSAITDVGYNLNYKICSHLWLDQRSPYQWNNLLKSSTFAKDSATKKEQILWQSHYGIREFEMGDRFVGKSSN
tara:strand:+ start:29812 stop:30132 length:321 start_codon:yes stop_codon:yes gene_type:complete